MANQKKKKTVRKTLLLKSLVFSTTFQWICIRVLLIFLKLVRLRVFCLEKSVFEFWIDTGHGTYTCSLWSMLIKCLIKGLLSWSVYFIWCNFIGVHLADEARQPILKWNWQTSTQIRQTISVSVSQNNGHPSATYAYLLKPLLYKYIIQSVFLLHLCR